MSAARANTLKANKARRNAKIRAEYKKRYTDAPRPRKFSREYIIEMIAQEKDLSYGTVENIIYKSE